MVMSRTVSCNMVMIRTVSCNMVMNRTVSCNMVKKGKLILVNSTVTKRLFNQNFFFSLGSDNFVTR